MTLIVEDGTGLPNANSYISVVDTDAYFTGRGNAKWASASPTDKESALVNATDYLDLRWIGLVGGVALTTTQSLLFPRTRLAPCARGAVLPTQVLYATAEYAVRALAGSLWPDPTVDPSGYAIRSKKTKVGPIETDIAFAAGSGMSGGNQITKPSYPIADNLLRCLLLGGGTGQIPVVRN